MSNRTRYRPFAGYERAYASLYGRTELKSQYRRDLLPEPADYYPQHLGKMHTRGEWADACCPLHEDKNPSLSVSLTHGGFICRGCGAQGDLLAFHMRLKNLDFVTAAKNLGAWEG
ncbi:MAG: CHC2 zinc finger domain-containing protein [Gammaproteobacteria bacterium]